MFDFPKALHRLSLFEEDGVLYAADIEKARVIEISDVMVDILKLAEEQRSDEIVQMKTNLRGKIREFVQSEEGKVGIKSPLTLGAAVGSVLLAQAIVGTIPADACERCKDDDDCPDLKECHGPFVNGWGTCH